ncbi:MAG: hypothetical protein F6K11_21550 [Leptolyngbya sp. SIO3F4]|nr:hypothetical protein [Leptolyngbya sp. SIO3F4]
MQRFWQNWTFGLVSFFLAIVITLTFVNQSRSNPVPMLLGLYTPDFVGQAYVLREQVQAIERWTGQQHSLVGLFLDLEAANPAYDIPAVLNRLHDNGYSAFINFTSRRTATQIAAGNIDKAIEKTAQAYGNWAKNLETPLIFIAPLPEMNGAWEVYGQTPDDFKQAYQRIQTIFAKEVPRDSIRWVFAPNGWSEPNHEFEQYYPGDQSVDVVAFSAYNWGHCKNASWKEWQAPDIVFGPYIRRMQQMAPEKPLFIAQTATTSIQPLGSNPTDKNTWLIEAYRYLATSGVRAVMYFNILKECDWEIFSHHGPTVNGYQTATNSPLVGYQSPEQLALNIPATP